MIVELLGELAKGLFEVLGYFVGRLVVFAATLGRVTVDRMSDSPDVKKMRWGGLWRRSRGRVSLSSECASIIGMIFLLIVFVVAALVFC